MTDRFYCVVSADNKVVTAGHVPETTTVEFLESHYAQRGGVQLVSETQLSAIQQEMLQSRAVFITAAGDIASTGSLNDDRVEKKRSVDVLLAERSTLPVSSNGALFDADRLSRERIMGTLLRLLRGDGLPAGWVGWRDRNNQMHQGQGTAISVQAMLSGLARAIEDREQALLLSAWFHKQTIDALPEEDVVAYDTTTGWPE